MIIADYHTHSTFSSDSTADMEDLVTAAIDKGLREIAITDHVDYDPNYEMMDFDKYRESVFSLKDKYKGKINVVYGIEIGLNNKISDTINKLTEERDFDFIIGSSHAVCGKDLYFDQKEFFEGKTKQEAYYTYFDEMLKNIKTTNDFCIYGHIDFVSRYGMYDDNAVYYDEFSDIIDSCLKEIISRGKGIEVNTSGYKYGINMPYPQFDILKRYKQLGGEIITAGSDAHDTARVADHFEMAYEMMKQAGFKYLSLYENREPKFEIIP